MLVEGSSGFVLGIDHERENRGIGIRRTFRRVHNQGATQPSAAVTLIDREPPNQPRGQCGITRQAFALFRREIGQRKTGGGKGVICRDRSRFIASDKTIADPPANILRRQLSQISVECLHTAGKSIAIVVCMQSFDRESTWHEFYLMRRR